MIAIMRRRVDALGRPFRALLHSELLTWLALMVGAVAAPWWIAGHGGARDLAIYGFSAAALAVIVMPVLSPLGDRLAKRRLIMLGLLLYALVALLLAWSTGAALWLQAGLLFSAVLLARRLPQRAPPAQAGRGVAAWRDDLRQGLRASWAMPLERGWTLVNFVGVLFMFPAFTMLVPLKIKALGLSGAWLGAAETGLSLGMLVGALGGSAWVARLIGRYATRVGATAAQGLGLALAGWTGQGEVLVLALFLVGLANSCGVLVGQTHRMLAIPAHFRARLSSVGMMTMNIAAAAGPALAGLALLKLEVATVYLLFGLLSAASALGFLFVPDFKTLLSLDHEQVKDWYAQRHPELFGPPQVPGLR